MNNHPFVVLVDEDPIESHVFGTLKMNLNVDGTPSDWITLERRCVLCSKTPLELLIRGRTVAQCRGFSSS